jgi:hypothetical protein
MVKSIQHFSDISIGVFQKLQEKFYEDPTDFASFIYGISDELRKLGVLMVQEALEKIDQQLRNSDKRKQSWVIEKKCHKKLVTSLGAVDFTKTLFTNKESGKMTFLVDKILGLDSHARLTEDAEARLLTEAVQTSYRRGGEACTISEDTVSKEAVKDRLHSLIIPDEWEKPKKKRQVDYLYIEADEDHVSLQFRNQKGDLKKTADGQKNNTQISKLVYVHEGNEPDAPKSRRHHLIHPRYFADVCGDGGNAAFWDKIYQYICDTYEVDQIKRIYLNADGGGWIKSGMKRINGLIFVMDEFHLSKYLIRLTSHMKDSTGDAREELCKAICHGTKAEFNEVVDRIRACLPDETGVARVEEARAYFLNNWMPARRRMLHQDGVIGCSAEGHVSHLLSSRMSSRPMGWSRIGAKKMTQLRAYYQNGGSMLELVRRQSRQFPKAAGDENEVIYSASEMLREERRTQKAYGKYIEKIQAGIMPEAKKYIHLEKIIWEL